MNEQEKKLFDITTTHAGYTIKKFNPKSLYFQRLLARYASQRRQNKCKNYFMKT